MSPPDSAHASILRQRETILQYTLWATVILASIAYFPSVWLGVRLDIPLLIIADTGAWVAAIVLAFWRAPAFQTRAMTFIVVWATFGLIILWLLGPIGAGSTWLLVVPVLSSLFFGYPGAYLGTAFIVLMTIAYALLLAFSAAPSPIGDVLVYELASWGGVSGTLIFLSAMVSLSIARLLAGLEQSLIERDNSRQQIASALSEREQLQEQLLHSQKLSALGTMASGIAHDFNNLLVPILMASEAARDDAPPGSAQHKHLGHVIISAERARDLIKRLLSFSQNLPQATKPIIVATALKETAVILRSSMPTNIAIHCDIEDPGARIMASNDALQQITMNLGTNACLAMKPDGGTLTLRQRTHYDSLTLRLEISDTGRGIPEHIQSRVFEPFFTTRAPGEGTGLGLSIVHRLVSDLGGNLTFTSSHVGTTFRIDFPLASLTPGLETRPAETTHAAPQMHALSILVVDDEELIRGTLRMILESAHHKVQEAASAHDALNLLGLSGDNKQQHKHIDLLITDETMPGMRGSDLAAKLAVEMPELPVMIISGQLDSQVREKLPSSNVVTVLDKPFNRKSLLAAVNAVHHKA